MTYATRYCAACATTRTTRAAKCIVCESDIWWGSRRRNATNPLYILLLPLIYWKATLLALTFALVPINR